MALHVLPGDDFVADGIRDLEHGVESEAALLVSIGAPRLSRLGLVIASPLPDPEHRLYVRLARRNARRRIPATMRSSAAW